jgi:tRNA U34 2-thiouridine synthase MnmA/TrmU
VVAFNFKTPFLSEKDSLAAVEAAKQLNIPIKVVNAEKDYLHMLKKPCMLWQKYESVH